MTVRIVGVDPSLTGTGVAIVTRHCGACTKGYIDADVIRPDPLWEDPPEGSKRRPKRRTPKTVQEQLDRVLQIHERVLDWTRAADIVVMEGASFSSVGGLQEERYWLRGLVLATARRKGQQVVIVSPSTLKFYATGHGGPRSDKDAMLAAARQHFPEVEFEDDNAADATWLAAITARQFGVPVDDVPAAHLKALDGVAWPDSGRAA